VFSAYGPGLARQILWDIYQQSRTASTIRLHGTGSEARDFIYVDDVVKSVHLAMLHGNQIDCQLLNVASGTSVTIERLAHLMLAALHRPPSVAFLHDRRQGDPHCWEVDVHRLRALGLTSCVRLEEGIRNYVTWLSAQERVERAR
jgi:dTDP-glucose 4,6-dehydratase/UDP-glucose 4-epimerase